LADVPEIRLASGQIVTEQEFANSLKEIRDQGYAYSNSERELGSASVAVPVFGQEGTLEASLQVSGPSVELDEEKVEWCILELKRASAAITKRLP
jgi:DNA-binding IclR family transcriptional regulator